MNKAPSSIVAGPCAPVCHWQMGAVVMDAAIGGGFAAGRVHVAFAASAEDATACAYWPKAGKARYMSITLALTLA